MNRVNDWVQLQANGIHTTFEGKDSGRKVSKQADVPVSIKASVENGIVSISDREHDIMLAVSLEDMTRVMAGAFRYHKELEEAVNERGEN